MGRKKFNSFNSSDDLMSYQAPFVTPIAGQTIGIIAVNFNFPMDQCGSNSILWILLNL